MIGLALQVRTRSKVHDYRFVAATQPTERWWEKNYGRWTDFSRPTILVEPGRFFVSGIVSQRTDSRGARIHYAFDARVEPEGRALAARVLAWLCKVRQGSGSLEAVGIRLDELGDDTWSAAVQGEQAAVERVDAAIMSLLQEAPMQAETVVAPQAFLLAASEQDAFARLGEMAAAVVALEPARWKRAVYLNLASSSELAELRDRSAIVCREIVPDPKTLRPLLAGAAVALVGLLLAAVFFLPVAY
ncbi:hypothetical protein [Massilia timonae]|uniref:hypothetical protein n=1 Tax=Massilia timonae TaxID=47229 RepID=UPI00289A3F0E|nr:hypothetical protein [Massilia timonae]